MEPEMKRSQGKVTDHRQLMEMLRDIVEMDNDGILVLDGNYRIQFANQKASEITGYSVQELIDKDFTRIVDKNCARRLEGVRKGREVFEKLAIESTIITSRDLEREVEICIVPAEDREGNLRIYIYLNDISERKKYERDLRRSEDKYRNLFERVQQGIFISTKEGRFLDCNQAMLDILSYQDKDEFLKLDIAKDVYVNPEDRREFQKLMERVEYIKNYEVTLKKKNGEVVPILLTSHPIKNESGEVSGYQGINIDISERVKMEQRLRKERSFFSNLLESSVDCIVVSDMKGKVIFFNKAAEKLTGYKVEEVVGKFNITRFYPLEVARDIMKKMRSEDFGGRGKLEKSTISFYGKDGEELPVSISASIVYEGDKEIASLGIFTDLREKIKMEKELQRAQMRLLQAEKMASLGSLSAGVAHEINNPLGGVLIYAGLLMEEFEEQNDPRSEDLKKIVAEGTRCKEIVRSLLEFGRQTDSRAEPIDINRAINDGLFFLENQVLFHNIEIVKELDPSLPFVQGDANQLKQVFMNMMVNAAEAMSEKGGQLTIKTGVNSDDPSVFILFKDTGVGIPREIQSKIFDPFFTTKEVGKGTGLGLSTSYGIIQSHHGNIEVNSAVEKGTTFSILLPLVGKETL